MQESVKVRRVNIEKVLVSWSKLKNRRGGKLLQHPDIWCLCHSYTLSQFVVIIIADICLLLPTKIFVSATYKKTITRNSGIQ